MSTQKSSIEFILSHLVPPRRFKARAMFGEYALYADDKVVALVCDDQLYVKIHPATETLAACDKDSPYPGAKPHYVVDEGRISRDEDLGAVLLGLAKALPAKKIKAKKKKAVKKKA